jgi:Phosphodiester glycosidase/PKD domain
MSLQKPRRRFSRWLKIVCGLGVAGLFVVCGSLAMVTFWPNVAAQNIDRLRDIIGDEAVAQLETVVLSIQDRIQQFEYQVGLVQPAAPWADSSTEPAMKQPTAMARGNSSDVAVAPTPLEQTATRSDILTEPTKSTTDTFTPSPPRPDNSPGPSPFATFAATVMAAHCTIGASDSSVFASRSVNFTANVNYDGQDSVATYAWAVDGTQAGGTGSGLTYTFPTVGVHAVRVTVTMKSGQVAVCATTVDVKEPPTPSNTVTPSTPAPGPLPAWQLPPLTPFGKLGDEGQWSPYMQAADRQTMVAYRTFLQPDPQRPYAIPQIVAFDLHATRLHFVLGTVEPESASPQPSRTGAIPAADLRPGILLATFNGGFRARHGHYGAMADGLIALPPINGLATVAMYTNGQVQIGEWGTDINASSNLVAWRQNGEMLIHNGKINPDVGVTTASWGRTIKGDTITWRSALGLSADGRTLYYVAGLQLDAATLARVMARTGAAEALELDVNNYWVHFTAIRSDGASLVAEPLFKAMKLDADRYLKSFSRDFFYITAATRP